MHLVTDPAIKSHPKNLALQTPLLVEWSRFSSLNEGENRARVAYVRAELERAVAAGISPLYAAITLPLEAQQTDAFAALADMESAFYLRLVEGCSPPHCDPQGRELPEEQRGKVLVAKVGLRSYPNGGQRNQAANRDQDLDRVRVLTRDKPTVCSLEDAIVIMRRWGYNVRPRKNTRPGQAPRRDEWLVVHVRDTGEPYGVTPPEPQTDNTRSRRQASL